MPEVALQSFAKIGAKEKEKQHCFDCRLKMAQRLPHGFPLYRESTFAEDYRAAKLSLILAFRAMRVNEVRSINNPVSLYCAIFSADVGNVRHLYLRDKQPVLVSKVELMETVEEVSYTNPSLVRLYSVEEPFTEADDGLLFFSGFEEMFKMFPGWVYRKPDFVDGVQAVTLGRFKPSKIESGAQIVNRVPTENSETTDNFLIRETHFEPLPALRINIRGNVVRCEASAEYLGSIGIEFIDVLSGPFDL